MKIDNIPRFRSKNYLLFVAVKETVKRGSEVVCRAKSNTYARRIAEALNRYKPGERGY